MLSYRRSTISSQKRIPESLRFTKSFSFDSWEKLLSVILDPPPATWLSALFFPLSNYFASTFTAWYESTIFVVNDEKCTKILYKNLEQKCVSENYKTNLKTLCQKW